MRCVCGTEFSGNFCPMCGRRAQPETPVNNYEYVSTNATKNNPVINFIKTHKFGVGVLLFFVVVLFLLGEGDYDGAKYKMNCSTVSYRELVLNSEEYMNASLDLEGEISAFLYDDDECIIFSVNVIDKGDKSASPNKTMYLTYYFDGELDDCLVVGDRIQFWGDFAGLDLLDNPKMLVRYYKTK